MSNQQGLADDDDFELTFMLFALDVLSVELVTLETETKEILAQLKKTESRKESKNRICERKKQKKNKYPRIELKTFGSAIFVFPHTFFSTDQKMGTSSNNRKQSFIRVKPSLPSGPTDPHHFLFGGG